MDPHVFWAIALFVIGVAIIGVELFVPSGGVLGFLSAAALVASVVVGYLGGGLLGTIMLAAVVILIPLVIVGFVKVWPHTPMGKRILIRADEVPRDPHCRGLKVLQGRVGLTLTKMLPSGSVEIDGRAVDAVSDGVPLDPGQLVRVISVTSNRVLVRPATAQEALLAASPDHDSLSAPALSRETAAGPEPQQAAGAPADDNATKAKTAFSPQLENLELDSLE